MGYLKQKFRSVQKLPTWIFWFPARLLQLLLHTLYRVKYDDPAGYVDTRRGAVGVTWHNRLCFFAAIFPKPTRIRTVAVVSASRDGQYITDIISHLGLKSLRGSSSKKGAHALLEAFRAVRDGYNVVFTPDGPRGPKYKMKLGPILLAGQTGAEIQPMAINASRYWKIRSWDQFQIPKPGATLTLVMGKGIAIPPDLDAEGLEKYRQIVEDALNAITVD